MWGERRVGLARSQKLFLRKWSIHDGEQGVSGMAREKWWSDDAATWGGIFVWYSRVWEMGVEDHHVPSLFAVREGNWNEKVW